MGAETLDTGFHASRVGSRGTSSHAAGTLTDAEAETPWDTQGDVQTAELLKRVADTPAEEKAE